MVLNETHSDYDQQNWRARVARERLDLSASVEEALENNTFDELHWRNESRGHTSFFQTPPEKSLFPPRLSLQTRFIPALHSGHVIESDSSPYLAVAASDKDPQPLDSPNHNPNTLKRFVHRLSTSLAAWGSSSPAQDFLPSSDSSSFSASSSTAEQYAPLSSSLGYTDELLLTDSSMGRMAAYPSISGQTQAYQSKQRLAGRATRVRLETVSPPVGSTQAMRSSQTRPSGASSDNERAAFNALNQPLVMNTELPVSDPLPPVTPIYGASQASSPLLQGSFSREARGVLSGQGAFVHGQSEAIVTNSHVTASSVVLVTMTSNPGPVVVQYISTRPYDGFTVHLTAPATMYATFNYIILVGELF